MGLTKLTIQTLADSSRRRVQAWSGFEPDAVDPPGPSIGGSYLEAASGAEFNLGTETDLLAGVMFKLGPDFIHTPGAQILWGNLLPNFGAPPPAAYGWALALQTTGSNQIQLSGSLARAVAGEYQVRATLTFSDALLVLPHTSGPTVAPSADRLIFGIMHYHSNGDGSGYAELYVNGGLMDRQTENAINGDYSPSPNPPVVGYAPYLAEPPVSFPNGESTAEIVGVCFSRFSALPAGVVSYQDLMIQSWQSTRNALKIGALTNSNSVDWDHKWNAVTTPTTPIIGPNGYQYVPNDPSVGAGPIVDEGNRGGLAAPSSPTLINLNVVGSALTVTTTENPEFFAVCI